jgi:hypothetical protein
MKPTGSYNMLNDISATLKMCIHICDHQQRFKLRITPAAPTIVGMAPATMVLPKKFVVGSIYVHWVIYDAMQQSSWCTCTVWYPSWFREQE